MRSFRRRRRVWRGVQGGAGGGIVILVDGDRGEVVRVVGVGEGILMLWLFGACWEVCGWFGVV